MADLSYILAVLSHGNPSPTVDRALASFRANVTPEPAATVHYHDGPGGPVPIQLGYCRATAKLWTFATTMAEESGATHVFWLEHDFVFERPVNLAALGAVLRDHRVAQASLMRQPVNAQEKRRGRVLDASDEGVLSEDGWLRHNRYFTTNPSLMRSDFMAAHPFGAGPSRLPNDIECEGRYGATLREAGYDFAVMGDGTPWVTHVGERTGHGY